MSTNRYLQVRDAGKLAIDQVNSYKFTNKELKDKVNLLESLLKTDFSEQQAKKEIKELMEMYEKIKLANIKTKEKNQPDINTPDKTPASVSQSGGGANGDIADPILKKAIQRCKMLIDKYQHEKENAHLVQEIFELRAYMLHKNLDAELLNNTANLIENIAKSTQSQRASPIPNKQQASTQQILQAVPKVDEKDKKEHQEISKTTVSDKGGTQNVNTNIHLSFGGRRPITGPIKRPIKRSKIGSGRAQPQQSTQPKAMQQEPSIDKENLFPPAETGKFDVVTKPVKSSSSSTSVLTSSVFSPASQVIDRDEAAERKENEYSSASSAALPHELAKDDKGFLSDENIAKINAELDSHNKTASQKWQHLVVNKEKTRADTHNLVDDQQFTVHRNKLATEKNDPKTFIVMLKLFAVMNQGTNIYPVINAPDNETMKMWDVAIKEVVNQKIYTQDDVDKKFTFNVGKERTPSPSYK